MDHVVAVLLGWIFVNAQELIRRQAKVAPRGAVQFVPDVLMPDLFVFVFFGQQFGQCLDVSR